MSKIAMQISADLQRFELAAINSYAPLIKVQYIRRTVPSILGGEDAAEKVADAE